MPNFTLVLPTYNPGKILHSSLRDLVPFAAERPDWEFIFVCDGCTDGSEQILEEYARRQGNFRVLKFSRNAGKGHAVRLGLLRSRGRYRIFTDIDLAYPLAMVEVVAEQLAAGSDVVIATRAHPESQVEVDDQMRSYMAWRSWQSRAFAAAAKSLLGLPQQDPQAGLKGFSSRAADLLMPYMRCNGFGFDCELLVACRFFGIHVREVPIHVRYTHGHSSTRLKTTLQMAADLWRIRRRWKRMGWAGLPRSVIEVQRSPVHGQAGILKRELAS